MNLVWNIEPMGSPRMTRADAWKDRPVVLRYHKFRDEVNFAMKKVDVDWSKFHRLTVVFYIPMAKSWSMKKKVKMAGKPHQQKPDIDNLVKALLDSIFRGGDDCKVWDINAMKLWTMGSGRIEITT